MTSPSRISAVRGRPLQRQPDRLFGTRSASTAVAGQPHTREPDGRGDERRVGRDLSRVRVHAQGETLGPGLRDEMGARLGAQLPDVRLHHGTVAADMTRRLDAVAVTAGADVFLAPDAPRPDMPGGRAVLAHELAHVIQQARGLGRVPSGAYACEAEASAVATAPGTTVVGSAPPGVPQRLGRDEADRQAGDEYLAMALRLRYADIDQFIGTTPEAKRSALKDALDWLKDHYDHAHGPRERAEAARLLVDARRRLAGRPAARPRVQTSTRTVGARFERRELEPTERTIGGLPGFADAVAGVCVLALSKPSADPGVVPLYKAQQKVGGGPILADGLAKLRGTTVANVLADLAAPAATGATGGAKSSPTTWLAQTGIDANLTLFDVTSQVYYVAGGLYTVDRTGHITPDQNVFQYALNTLAPGTYFFAKFRLAGDATPLLVRLDRKARLASGDIVPATVNQDLWPLLRRAGDIRVGIGGIALIVDSARHRTDPATQESLAALVERVPRHLRWAIRTALISELQRFAPEHLAETVLSEAAFLGLGRLAASVPPLQLALFVQRLADESIWLGETLRTALFAMDEDQLDIAAQRVARKLADEVVGQVKRGLIGLLERAARSVAGRAGAASPVGQPESSRDIEARRVQDRPTALPEEQAAPAAPRGPGIGGAANTNEEVAAPIPTRQPQREQRAFRPRRDVGTRTTPPEAQQQRVAATGTEDVATHAPAAQRPDREPTLRVVQGGAQSEAETPTATAASGGGGGSRPKPAGTTGPLPPASTQTGPSSGSGSAPGPAPETPRQRELRLIEEAMKAKGGVQEKPLADPEYSAFGPEAEEKADLEEFAARHSDPVLARLLTGRAARRGTEQDTYFKDIVAPELKPRFGGSGQLYTTRDSKELKAALGVSKLPWPDGAGPDVILADSESKRVAMRDLTSYPNPTHQAKKVEQAKQLQVQLGPGWNVDTNVLDFYYGKGTITTKSTLDQLHDLLISFGYVPEGPDETPK